MPSSSVEPDNGVAATAAAAAAFVPSRLAVDERLVSSLRTQTEVDFLCEKHGVPSAYNPRPAGDDRRAWTPPPPGSVCVYAHALEAGMRVPLHGFFCEVLTHFGIAPAQLVPNGWRVMAGYLALCRSVGVPPALAVFRRFFLLSIVSSKHRGWYYFRFRDSTGLRFTGMPNTPMDWKKLFFFLSSPDPWPCPVEWGEPSRSSFVSPALTSEENRSAAKLLDACGGGAVDIKTCLGDGDGNLAVAMVAAASLPPPASSSTTRITSSSKGLDPSVYKMMRTMRVERAAAQASAAAGKKVKAEPGSDAPGLCGSKTSLGGQANGEEGPPRSVLLNTRVLPPPPGFPRKRHHFAGRHAGDTTDWRVARELLQSAAAPPQERVFAASEPSDVVRSSFGAVLQTLELEGQLAARDAEVAALRKQLEEAKAELAAVKRPAAEAEGKSALKHLLVTEENVQVRRRAEHALEGYERWRDDSSMVQRTDRRKRRPEPSSKYDPKQWVL